MRGPNGLRTQYVTRVRLGSASYETANLSRKALEIQKQCSDPRSRKGASGLVLFFGAPWSGCWERSRFRRSSFCGVSNAAS